MLLSTRTVHCTPDPNGANLRRLSACLLGFLDLRRGELLLILGGMTVAGSMPRDERPKGALLLSAWGNAPGTGIHHDQSPEGATQARWVDAYMESTMHGMVRPYRAACGVGF